VIGGAVEYNLSNRDLADHRLPPRLEIDRQGKANFWRHRHLPVDGSCGKMMHSPLRQVPSL